MIPWLLVIAFFLLNPLPSKADCGYILSNDGGITGPADSVLFFEGVCGIAITNDITITNNSTETLSISLQITGDGGFTVTPDKFSLAVGVSGKVSISFMANAATRAMATLTIVTATGCTSTISLFGDAIPFSGGKNCLETAPGDDNFDPILDGGSAEHTLTLINSSNFAITIDKTALSGPDAGDFVLTSSLPLTVPAHTMNGELKYTFTPSSKTDFFESALLTLELSGDSLDCTSVDAMLNGMHFGSGDPLDSNGTRGHNPCDTMVFPLFPNNERTLSILGLGNTFFATATFNFVNNLATDVTIKGVHFTDGTYFSVVSTTPSPLPTVLKPQENFSVTIGYMANDFDIHLDELVIDAEHTLQATKFKIQGLKPAAAGVGNGVTTNAANFFPDPVNTFLAADLTGKHHVKLQVIDLLGKTVHGIPESSTGKWDFSGVPAGTYIVRMTGVKDNGEAFTVSDHILVSK